jgi:transposase-like protein
MPGFKKYVIRSGEERQLYKCNDCDSCFSETKNTVLEGNTIAIKPPLPAY